ncbi:MAG TPA: NAD(P)-dependent alcohol dehydrogenase [Caulobacteraceae bacterium]|nr:NAD(P)-dependent alcohol dehydrogenase [Caulobacteraceae bacterium]
MRAVVLESAYGIDNLKVIERPDPTPGPGQIVVHIKAASLNYRDLATVTVATGRTPFTPCSDGAGVVSATGEGVTRAKVGDAVAPLFFPGWLAGVPTPRGLGAALGGTLDGVLQDKVLISQEGVTPVPAGYTFEEAATLPCAALTAWRGLVVEGKVKSGDVVVVQGTGGVSIFALQFAKAAGARVIVTSSSDEKLARAKTLGADHLVNYRSTPDWAKEVRRVTDGRGADHVVEVGGAGTFEQSLRAIRLGGHIAVIGILGGFVKDLNVAAIFAANAVIHGVTVGSRAHFESMTRAIEAIGLKPVIDKRFPLDQSREAFECMKAGAHFGKIVITL